MVKSNQGAGVGQMYVNGVEITSQIEFAGWKTGLEYTKNLNFKNLNTKPVRLIYKLATPLFNSLSSFSPTKEKQNPNDNCF